jgi:hypothetical protein
MTPHGVEGSRIRFSWHRGESEVMAAIRRNIIDTLIRKGSCRICCGSAGPGLVSGEEKASHPNGGCLVNSAFQQYGTGALNWLRTDRGGLTCSLHCRLGLGGRRATDFQKAWS